MQTETPPAEYSAEPLLFYNGNAYKNEYIIVLQEVYMKQDRFSYPSKQAVADDARQRNLPLPWSERTELLAEPCELSGISLRNRLLAQPIEGFDANPDGSPSNRTVRRYCELARGGSGALWLESVSVNHQGRSNPMQLWITEENADTFKSLVSAIRESAPGKIYLVLQLTHSGRNSNPDGTPTPICAFHSHAIPKENETIITDEALEALEEDYVRAALLAEQAGFDAVDIRACHGYLINELFAAVNRPGRYGGSFENRTRLLMNIVDRVQRVSRVTVGVRINMYDGIPYPDGWGVNRSDGRNMDLTEPMRLISALYAHGVRLLNVTCGVGAYSPFVIRPYDTGGPEPWEHPLKGISRMQLCAKEVKQAAPEAVVIASAFSWLREAAPLVAAGGIEAGWYDVAGFGRDSIANPSYANDILQTGELRRENCCVACCGCTNLIKKSGKMLRCIMRSSADSL